MYFCRCKVTIICKMQKPAPKWVGIVRCQFNPLEVVMIHYELSPGLKSLLKVREMIISGKLSNPDEICIYLYLFSDLEICQDQSKDIDPLEIEPRIDLLLRLAEYPNTRQEGDAFSLEQYRVREKAEEVLLRLVSSLKFNGYRGSIKALSLETVKRISSFYSRIEHLPKLPKHKKQLENLLEFFQCLYYWDQYKTIMPTWLNEESQDAVRNFLIEPMIPIGISYVENIGNQGEVSQMAMVLLKTAKEKLLNKLDYYVRGNFRINNPSTDIDGPQYPDQSYEAIIGLEMTNPIYSSRWVIRAAQISRYLSMNT